MKLFTSLKIRTKRAGTTSKVGALSKTQKAQSFYYSRGGPFGLFKKPVCRKISKTLRGTLWRHFNSLIVPKNLKGETLRAI